jgi:hypothetical protein
MKPMINQRMPTRKSTLFSKFLESFFSLVLAGIMGFFDKKSLIFTLHNALSYGHYYQDQA